MIEIKRDSLTIREGQEEISLSPNHYYENEFEPNLEASKYTDEPLFLHIADGYRDAGVGVTLKNAKLLHEHLGRLIRELE